MRRALLAVLLASVFAPPPALHAQGFRFTPRIQPEARLDAVADRYASALLMAGANAAMGYYVRTGVAVGAGVAGSPDGTVGAVRADLAVRYLLDPFAEYKWGPYAGGGLTVRRDGARRARAGLMLVLGVEGRRAKRWTPALEFALGEGTRLALVLRRSRANGR